jgi:hypothetical protein
MFTSPEKTGLGKRREYYLFSDPPNLSPKSHPGAHLADILKEEAGLSSNALALRLRVPANRISGSANVSAF